MTDFAALLIRGQGCPSKLDEAKRIQATVNDGEQSDPLIGLIAVLAAEKPLSFAQRPCYVPLDPNSRKLVTEQERLTMKAVKFINNWFAEVESTPGRLQQVAFHQGEIVLAAVCLNERKGPVSTANLRLANGTTALNVPLSQFAVGDEFSWAA